MDVSTSMNAAALRASAQVADRSNQARVDEQRAEIGRPAVADAKQISKGKGRKLKAAESFDGAASYQKTARDESGRLVDIIT